MKPATMKRIHTEQNLLKGSSTSVRNAYFEIKNEVKKIDKGIKEKLNKSMMAYYSNSKGLLWVEPLPVSIRLHFRKGQYSDICPTIKEGLGGYPDLYLGIDDYSIELVRPLIRRAFMY